MTFCRLLLLVVGLVHLALAKPVQTRWIVFTGPPCSGKTTIINALAERGYDVQPESVRQFAEQLQKTKHPTQSLEQTLLGKEMHYVSLYARIVGEQHTSPTQITLFDRATPDSFAYFDLNHHDVTRAYAIAKTHVQKYRYAMVFLFEKLPMKHDGVRYENDAERDRLFDLYDKHYRAVGYMPIRVPVMSIDDRLNFVLQEIKKVG